MRRRSAPAPARAHAGRSSVILLPLGLLLVALLGACGGGGTAPPPEAPPVITVTGVEDGAVLTEPATVTVSVDKGTFQATLNGEPFFSGTTVADPGSYELVVVARDGELTSTEVVRFEIRLGGDSLLIVRLFDLGENGAGGGGDAILLTDSAAQGERHAMIDAGPAGAGGNDRDFVQSHLEALGIDTLEVLLLTHAHSDHLDGMADILRETTVETFFYNGQVRSFSRYEQVVDLAEARAGAVVVPDVVSTVELGLTAEPSVLRVIPPLPTFIDDDTNDGSEINEGSLGAELSKGAFRIFLTGDGEFAANRRWEEDFSALSADVDVLKVGHHGANDAVSDGWLSHTDAEVHVISANGTTHPRIRALVDLQEGANGTRTFCTNVHGDIEIRVGPTGAFDVTVQRNEGMDCEPGEDAQT